MMDDKARNQHIANFVKNFRSSRGFSLDDLAQESGVSRSMIFQIEAEQTNPTLSVLSKLASAMGIALSELVDPISKPTLYRLQCLKDSKSKHVSADGSFVCSLLSEGSGNRHIEIFAFEFSKKGKYQSRGHGPRAIEYLFLTHGDLVFSIDGEELVLNPGDLLEFRASGPHLYRQESKHLAKGLSIIFYGV